MPIKLGEKKKGVQATANIPTRAAVFPTSRREGPRPLLKTHRQSKRVKGVAQCSTRSKRNRRKRSKNFALFGRAPSPREKGGGVKRKKTRLDRSPMYVTRRVSCVAGTNSLARKLLEKEVTPWRRNVSQEALVADAVAAVRKDKRQTPRRATWNRAQPMGSPGE